MASEAVFRIQFNPKHPKQAPALPMTCRKDMEEVRALVQATMPEENVTCDDITITDIYSEVPGVFTLCFRDVPIGNVMEAQHDFHEMTPIMLNNLCPEVEQAADAIPQIAKYSNLCEEIATPSLCTHAYQFHIKQWIDSVLSAMKEHPDMVKFIDSIPEELKKVGDTHVIVPSPENMTEDMVDASRSLLLYTDTFNTNDSARICKRISMRSWVMENLPEWFKEDKGHLTKAGRASLAYHLTVMAAVNPPAPEDKYFPETKKGVFDRPSKLGFELELFHEDELLSITRTYETIWNTVTHGDMLDIQINRHQLPDYWKRMFKKNAIEISGRIAKTPDDSEVYLDNVVIRLGVKAEFAGTITERFTAAKRIVRK